MLRQYTMEADAPADAATAAAAASDGAAHGGGDNDMPESLTRVLGKAVQVEHIRCDPGVESAWLSTS